MNRSLIRRNWALGLVLGAVVLAGLGASSFDTSPIVEPGPSEDKLMKGKLKAEDLGPGWSELPQGPDAPKRSPKQSDALSGSEFCGAAFSAAHSESRSLKGAFRRKDAKGGPAAAKGQSKLLAQRLLEYEGDGTVTGAEKATAVLDQLKAASECAGASWKTNDPAGQERTWTLTPQPSPGIGPKSMHFRATTIIGNVPESNPDAPSAGTGDPITVENDIIVVQRGKVLNVIIETSPGGDPESANEAKGNAGKAHSKLDNEMSS